MSPSGIVYWLRFVLALVAGGLCFALRLAGTEGLWVAIIVFLVSYLAVKYGFKYADKELKGKNKRVMIGIGTYIFIWAMVWILLYTLFPYPL